MVTFKKIIPTLPVINIQKAVDFYENKMGFVARHKEKWFAIVVRGGIEIHLSASCDHRWKIRSIFLFLKPIMSGAESFLAGTASCRIEVEGVEELYQEYKEKGILHIEQTTIVEQEWGQKDFPTLDLYGNTITFWEEMS